jgi:hypothetical protein
MDVQRSKRSRVVKLFVNTPLPILEQQIYRKWAWGGVVVKALRY